MNSSGVRQCLCHQIKSKALYPGHCNQVTTSRSEPQTRHQVRFTHTTNIASAGPGTTRVPRSEPPKSSSQVPYCHRYQVRARLLPSHHVSFTHYPRHNIRVVDLCFYVPSVLYHSQTKITQVWRVITIQRAATCQEKENQLLKLRANSGLKH